SPTTLSRASGRATSTDGMIARVKNPPPRRVYSASMTAPSDGAGAPLAPLSTKLVAPPRRPAAIERVELLERMEASAQLPLTLVCAPAGFGKTTLLVDWLARTGMSVAWVALDSADNDAVLFWTNCLAALQHVDSSIGASALALLRTRHGAPFD